MDILCPIPMALRMLQKPKTEIELWGTVNMTYEYVYCRIRESLWMW